MSTKKCASCGELFSRKLSACPSCGADYAGPPSSRKSGETHFRPLAPCACGKPQIAAVVVNYAKIPKCEACYMAFWNEERIRTKPQPQEQP